VVGRKASSYLPFPFYFGWLTAMGAHGQPTVARRDGRDALTSGRIIGIIAREALALGSAD
jgi:hypothetical protein